MHGDCLELLATLPDGEVDMVLSDPPYGVTRNRWDCQIDMKQLWPELIRVTKDNAAIIMTAAPPYDKVLACSNLKLFRYDWVWEKGNATGHLNAKRMPLKAHENVLVFYKRPPIYCPQKTVGHKPVNAFYSRHSGNNYGAAETSTKGGGNTTRYPRTVQRFKSDKQTNNRHPSQKPLALLQYMLRTYTKPGDLVLDFCMGSGSTGEACRNEGRQFIGIENDREIFATTQAYLQAA
jgi:site-specific DNA-methyltransferase (adenine-specific)